MLVHRNLSAYAAACVKKHGVQNRAIIKPLLSLTWTLEQMYIGLKNITHVRCSTG